MRGYMEDPEPGARASASEGLELVPDFGRASEV